METGATEETIDAAAQSAPETVPAEQGQAPSPSAPGDKQAAPEAKPRDSRKKHHGHKDQADKHAHAKPAPQGALQEALKKTAPDWKAYRDQQIAAGREQRTFWLTEDETQRVRSFLWKLRNGQGAAGGKKKKAGKPHGAPVNRSVPNPVKAKKAHERKEGDVSAQEAPKPVQVPAESAPDQL